MMPFKIGKYDLEKGRRTFIIAELSANHGKQYALAERTIKAARDCGADAIKFQTYTPDTMTVDVQNHWFRISQGTIWDGEYLYDLYKKAYTPWEWQPKLKQYAESLGLLCFSTPFDRSSVDFLEKMRVPAYKVASFEITDIPLLEYIAAKQKPIIISTGIADAGDIRAALSACARKGNRKVALLKCTSSYPAALEDMNIATIPDMSKRFKCVVGLSDHSMGAAASLAAISLGARILEKHFILDRKLGGPDASFSLEPAEFKALVSGVREAEKVMGRVTYALTPQALRNRKFSRSIFVVDNMEKGEIFTEKNIRSIRPGDGMPPVCFPKVLGKKAARRLTRGTPLKSNMIAGR